MRNGRRSTTRRTAGLLLACAVAMGAAAMAASPAVASPPGDSTDVATLGRHLERVGQAYFDLMGQYPAHYQCELRSPGLVASLDPKGREAWGDGRILPSKTASGFQLTAEGLARPEAAPLFNFVLGLWQLHLGTQLKVVEAHLPSALTAIAAGLAAAPFTHEAFEERTAGLIRFELRARNADHPVQELRHELTPGDELRAISVRNRDGGGLEQPSSKQPRGAKWRELARSSVLRPVRLFVRDRDSRIRAGISSGEGSPGL